MNETLRSLFEEHGINPVLVEIGPRERSPEIWDPIARAATYVAAGPDAHLNHLVLRQQFGRVHLIEALVTPEKSASPTTLYVTRDPVYSSTLPPSAGSSHSAYLDGQCLLDHKETVPTVTLDELAARLELTAIDWLNTNVNGLDSHLYASLDATLRRRLLALDTVVDLVSFWERPGSPASVLQRYMDDGLWVSECSSCGLPRMRQESVRRLHAIDAKLDETFFGDQLKRSPGWLFVRFLRSLESMAAGKFNEREYLLLWTFAMLDRQWGYAADIAFEMGRVFGQGSTYRALVHTTLDRVRRLAEDNSSRHPARWSNLLRRISV